MSVRVLRVRRMSGPSTIVHTTVQCSTVHPSPTCAVTPISPRFDVSPDLVLVFLMGTYASEYTHLVS